MDATTRQALVRHLGELTMETVCSVARAQELERENAELRRLVTEERMRGQQAQDLQERTFDDVAALRAQVEELQAQLQAAKKNPVRPRRAGVEK